MRYRLYNLQGARLAGLSDLEARDDLQAAELARTAASEGVVEIWCGPRRVRTVPALRRETA
jgi:hypothetical protein